MVPPVCGSVMVETTACCCIRTVPEGLVQAGHTELVDLSRAFTLTAQGIATTVEVTDIFDVTVAASTGVVQSNVIATKIENLRICSSFVRAINIARCCYSATVIPPMLQFGLPASAMQQLIPCSMRRQRC